MIVLLILFASNPCMKHLASTLVFKGHTTIFTIEYYKIVPHVEPMFLRMQNSRL